MIRGLLNVLVLFAIYNVTYAIIGGAPADPPPAPSQPQPTPPPTVTPTESSPYEEREELEAIIQGLQNDDGTSSFLGMRYAEPPVQRLRFQRPKKFKLKGEVDATKLGPPCPQWHPYQNRVIGREDCLFLNVFSPKIPTTKTAKYPVIFWIHGGNFKTGSAAQYVPTQVVRKGVVVVTVNYRLGSLGFLSTGRKGLPGNVGMFDIATALKWVKDYIKHFEGDPNRIYAAGQGSGASVASMLAMNKNTRSGLGGVIAMSGSPVSPFALDENEKKSVQDVKEEVPCKQEGDLDFVRCMQKLPLEEVLKGDTMVEEKRKKSDEFPKGLANLMGPGPTEEGPEDGRFLPHFVLESPLQSIKKGNFPDIPLMTGTTKDETGGGVKGSFFKNIQKKILSPEFLQGGIFKDLLTANTGLYENKTVNPSLSSLFLKNDYVQFFTSVLTSALSDMQKVVKHTTDAFFNLPAFITSHLWSKKNKVYLYSFEHTPKKSVSKEFLGIPLASREGGEPKDKQGPEHGDDLMYLFDLKDIEGKPLNTSFDKVDEKVRDHFTDMVAEFARSGVPKAKEGDSWSPFTEESGNYMIIDATPKLAGKFKKCEMGLWTGDSNILNSPDCSALNQAGEIAKATIGAAGSQLLSSVDSVRSQLLDIPGVPSALPTGLPSIPSGLPTIPSALPTIPTALPTIPTPKLPSNPLSGLLGSKTTPKTKITATTTTAKPKGGVLGGFLG